METKVFVVRYQSLIDGEIVDDHVNVFSDKHSAEKHFNKCVKDEQEYIRENNWKLDAAETNTHYFCAFENGRFALNRVMIDIQECPLQTNLVSKGGYEYDKDALDNWEKQASNAVVIYDNPDDALYVEISPNYLKFFKRDDVLSVYTYPPLSELKKSKELIKCIEEYINESTRYKGNVKNFLLDGLHIWKESTNVLPSFPLTIIWYCDFEGFQEEIL